MGPADGLTPVSSLVEGSDGNFYGTTSAGGPFNNGTVFRQTPAGVLTTLYSFTGGNDGSRPTASLVLGPDGNFYGTASAGGASGAGTVFKITPAGSLTTLYTFTGGDDGQQPMAALVLGNDGNFYGVTSSGGAQSSGTQGGGTVFKITPDGNLTTLHSLYPQTDGRTPSGALVLGPDGNFYGTTSGEGPVVNGAGTVFRCTPDGVYTVLYSFGNYSFGAAPEGPLALGTDGNFYGTTSDGGFDPYDCTVFKITPDGTLTTLATFATDNGTFPQAGLVLGPDGNFYGTATDPEYGGDGFVFKVTPDGTLTTVHQFNGSDGRSPEAALVLGRDGNFYGTTAHGGSADVGTVFALSAGGVLTSLHSFTYGSDGAVPVGSLLLASDGYLYGVTANGGPTNNGTVFRVGRDGTQTVLAAFNGVNGASPTGALVQGSDGNFYGETASGGATNAGTVFRMTPAGVVTTIHSFDSDIEGSLPDGGLLLASDGYFYGVTANTGPSNFSGEDTATVFRMDAQGSLTVLHVFANDGNGNSPAGPLVEGSDGNFYGALVPDVALTGHLFRMTPDGTVTLLHEFSPSPEGDSPNGGLVQGSGGSFYGTASSGGPNGGGTLFNITASGAFSALYALDPDTDGSGPIGGLVLAANGNLYGTASGGGANGNGTIYELTASGAFNVLYTFGAFSVSGTNLDNQDGAYPPSALVQDADGNLYGVASGGGAAGLGTVFELSPVRPAFFTGEVGLGNGVFYLGFADGNPFGYYSYLSDPAYLYHFDLGYEYILDAADGRDGVYLYDFASSTFFYTSPTFPFPYLYDFSLNSVLYYYPDPNNPGHYNTNGVRYFYDFATGKIIVK